MSAEKLKELVERGPLINLNIVSDSLASLLHEVATMLVDQQRQIAQLKKDIGDRLPSEDFFAFKESWRTDRDNLAQAVPNLEAAVQRLSREMEDRSAALRGDIEEAVNSILMTVDNRIAQKLDSVGAEQAVTRQALSAVENKLKDISATQDDALAARVQLLEGRVSELSQRTLSSETQKDTAGAEALQKQEALKNDIEELKKELQQLKDTVEEGKTAAPRPHTELEVPDHTGIPGYNLPSSVKLEGPSSFMNPVPAQMPSGLSDPIDTIEDDEVEMNEIDELRQGLAQMEEALEQMNKSLVSRIERKSENNLVERMFEKLRVIIASVRDDITALQGRAAEFVTRAEMEEYVQAAINAIFDDDLAAASNRPYKCLACGRPRVRQSQADTYVLSPPRNSTNELPSLHPRSKI